MKLVKKIMTPVEVTAGCFNHTMTPAYGASEAKLDHLMSDRCLELADGEKVPILSLYECPIESRDKIRCQ